MLSRDTDSEPLNILVFGPTGAGKSTIINHLTSEQLPVGHSLQSCTREVQVASIEHQGRLINYFDTPGLDDSVLTSAEQLARIGWLSSALYKAAGRAPSIHGIIYVHRITDNKMPGSALHNLRVLEKLLGSDAANNLVFVTNMWGSQPDPEHVRSEQELITDPKYFASAIADGARAGEKYRICRGANDAQIRETLLDLFLNSTPVTIQIQRDMVDEKRALRYTDAGRIVYEEVKTIIQGTKEFIRELKVELAALPGGKEVRRRRIVLEQKDAENQYEQAKKQEGILHLVLGTIREHPYLSTLMAIAVVGAAAAGLMVLGSGKVVVVAKFVGTANMAVSGTGTAAAVTASPIAGTCAGTATGAGVVSVSVGGGLAAGWMAIVKGSKENRETAVPD